MRPRWPAYYLAAARDRIRAGPWPELDVDALAPDRYRWELPGDDAHYARLGARPVAVVRERRRLGTALVVTGSPQRLAHPEATEVLESAAARRADAADVVLAIVRHVAGRGGGLHRPPGSRPASGARPTAGTRLPHHGCRHGLRQRGRAPGRARPAHHARGAEGAGRLTAARAAVSSERRTGSRQLAWPPPSWSVPSWPWSSWKRSSWKRSSSATDLLAGAFFVDDFLAAERSNVACALFAVRFAGERLAVAWRGAALRAELCGPGSGHRPPTPPERRRARRRPRARHGWPPRSGPGRPAPALLRTGRRPCRPSGREDRACGAGTT